MSDEPASRSLPRFPGGPDPTQPVPRDAVDGVDLARCGRIAAEVAEAPANRQAVLARHGLDERRWMEIEQTWMLRVATAVLQGELSLVQQYDAAFARAQDLLGPPQPARALETYAGMVAQLEAAASLPELLAQHGMTQADWTRLQRHWTARLATERELARRFSALRAPGDPGRGDADS